MDNKREVLNVMSLFDARVMGDKCVQLEIRGAAVGLQVGEVQGLQLDMAHPSEALVAGQDELQLNIGAHPDYIIII